MSRRCRTSLQDTFTDDKDPLDPSGSSGCRCKQVTAGTGGAPCTEPLIYDTNVVLSRRPELLEAEYTDTLEIPTWYGPNRLYEFKACLGLPNHGKVPVIPWHQNGVEFDNRWILNKTQQRTGDYCAEGGVGTGSPGTLKPATLFTCKTTGASPDFDPQTARVLSGDLITVDIYAKLSTGVGTLSTIFNFNTELPSTLTGVDINSGNLTTAYVRYTAMCFAPATAYWLLVDFDGRQVSGGPIIYLDDASVIVNKAGSNVLLCAFGSLITIDNSTTETSFL